MKTVLGALKAIAAGTVAGLTIVVQELTQDDHLGTQEIISAVIAFIVGTGIVYYVPNRKKA